jgi:hypothetical protein
VATRVTPLLARAGAGRVGAFAFAIMKPSLRDAT